MSPTDLSGWDDTRWAAILDRIEHRQPGIGLRFWGPPLWLEVTMTGADSDLWPSVSDEVRSWDWQSNAPCDLAGLVDAGADDDELLGVVARYTIENLILNTVHEIGEWFRLDGRRLFPAHRSGVAPRTDRDDQGNGAVTLELSFGRADHRPAMDSVGPSPDEHRRHLVSRLIEAVAPSRFTYLPGATVSYDPEGPVVRTRTDGEATSAWRESWSFATLDAIDAEAVDVVAHIGRDVHAALVSHEADRICRAFHVDGHRLWSLRAADGAAGADPPDADASDAQWLSLVIDYVETS